MTIDSSGGLGLPSVVSGRYELLFELASGGMGTVFVGRRLGADGFQRLVAIKRMHPQIAQDPEAIAAFKDEARIASLVQHANVVAIHDVCHEGGEHLLVMDYIDGVSLATLLATLRAMRKRLSRRVALRIVSDALHGLHAAHELVTHDGRPLELVHRDATPHNILLGVDGSVRLTDFGIARAAMRTVHTQPGFAKGKYCYMAPEQAFAEPLDRRADVFAMGIVAWEALTGRRLFANRTIQEVARGVALGEIPAPSEVGAGTPEALDGIVLRALAPWRDDRYPSAAALAEAIACFAESEGGLAPSSAVAEVLDLICGAPIRERRERIRAVLCAKDAAAAEPRLEPMPPSQRTSSTTSAVDSTKLDVAISPSARRVPTPTSASIDVPVHVPRRPGIPNLWRGAPVIALAAGVLIAGSFWLTGVASDLGSRCPTARTVGARVMARAAGFLAREAAEVRAPTPCVNPVTPGRARSGGRASGVP